MPFITVLLCFLQKAPLPYSFSLAMIRVIPSLIISQLRCSVSIRSPIRKRKTIDAFRLVLFSFVSRNSNDSVPFVHFDGTIHIRHNKNATK